MGDRPSVESLLASRFGLIDGLSRLLTAASAQPQDSLFTRFLTRQSASFAYSYSLPIPTQ